LSTKPEFRCLWTVAAALFFPSFVCQAQQSLQILHSHVRPAVSNGQAEQAGVLPPGQRLNLTIVLPLRNQGELDNLLGRLYDPSSPDYHHFLSVDEFTAQFGPTAEDYQAVVDFAQANGFSVTGRPANRLIVPINGSVAQVEKAFHVRMNVYRHPTEHRTFFSPDREPSLNLSVRVAHIAGLNNFSLPRSTVTKATGWQAIANVSGSGPGGSYLAKDMRAAYYTSSLATGATALTGISQTVGILEFDGYNISDVVGSFDGTATSSANGSNYLLSYTPTSGGATYSIPVNNVLLDGATGAPLSGDDAEQVLDIVQAVGMAPGLNQVRVYVGDGSYFVDDANIFNAMATENIAKQLSVSWAWAPDDPSTDDGFFAEFAAQGQSLFVASGDSGAFDASISPYFYPGEDDYVTAVGATHLTTNGAAGPWVSERAWNSNEHGSGGGVSPDGIAIPSWQAGVANASNGGSTTLRNVPDVAMEGDYDNYNCDMGSCEAGWAGTSFAAPRWAGFMAVVNQQAVEAGTAPSGGLGFINQTVYSIGEGSGYASDLHDITSGNNDTDNQPVWFSAVTGYDLVTGWGSPTGQDLVNALAGPQVPGFWLQASTGLLTVNPGSSGSATITVNDADGFTGSVNLAVTSGLPSGVTASWSTNPTTGSSVLTLTAAGSAPDTTGTLTITGTSGQLTVTTFLAVSVSGSSFILSASPASLSINQGASGTSTITVNPYNGFSGNVSLGVTSTLPVGVTASWGTNPTTGTSVLTLTANSSAPYSTGPITITGTSGALTASTTLSLTVSAPGFTLADSPSELNLIQGSSDKSTITVTAQNGFSGNVNLAVTGLPSGVTGSWSTNPTAGSSVLNLTATPSAGTGTFSATITGTSGALTASLPLALTVSSPPAPTTTALSVTSAGTPVNSVASGSVVTLTAQVNAGSSPLTTGQVKFCDATAVYCEDIHILGAAQLTSAGTAALNFIPGIGSHSYKAVFVGANGNAASSSSPSALAVTGQYGSTTAITQSGVAGDYTLTATVTGQGPLAPTGTVSFLDTNNGNLSLGTATLSAGQPGLSWLNSQSPATGSKPSSIASGDFNGDGIPDLAVSNFGNSTLTILLGNGNGTFKPKAVNPQTGSGPGFVAVGDFNGDGKPDLAVANITAGTVTILLGNGDGTFTATSVSPQTGSAPSSIAVGDFNGDGIPDLAIANSGSNTVTVLLGIGNGTFTTASASPPTGTSPVSIVSADFNEDGIPDLALLNYDGGTITILLGNGDGTFAPTAQSPQTGSNPETLAIGDFNGDGIPDLAVANSASDTVTVLLGNGDGTFSPTPISPPANSPYSIVVGDFNRDGNADIAATDLSQGGVTILLGNGNGTFAPAIPGGTTGSYPESMVVADFNGDGYPDLATANFNGSNTSVLLTQKTYTASASAAGIAPIGTGTHQVDASYAGDSNYNSSVSPAIGITALQSIATVTVTPSSLSITTAQQLQVSVSVSGTTGNPQPTGSVTLTSGAYTSASTTLIGGSATIVIPANALGTGSDTLTATYSGDSNYSTNTGTAAVTVTATPQGVLLTPAPGSVLTGTSATFSWTSAPGAVNYELFLGSTGPGSYNVYYSGNLTATTLAINSLPINGETIYARLYTRFNATLVYQDYTFTATTLTSATLSAPLAGSTFTSTSATFTWAPVTGATSYELFVGSTVPGSYNVYYSGNVTVTSVAVNGLPVNGEKLYVRLYTRFGGTLTYLDYTYTAETLTTATLTAPAAGTTFTSASATFTWNPVPGVTNYELFLGSTVPGSYNVYYSGDLTVTTLAITSLPVNGETIYARLYTRLNGTLTHTDYTFTAASLTPAALTAPTPGSTFTATSATFTWTAAAGATNYELFLGSTGPGSYNVLYSGNRTGTTLNATGLPTNGEKIYARLYTRFGTTLVYEDYTFTATTMPPAALTSPTQGSTFTGASATFTWNAASGATDYELFLGSMGPGSYNVYYSGDLSVTSVTVNNLPTNGETIYARLYTNFSGTLEYYDYTFTAQ
jgi:hypothetical protein